MPAFGRLLFSYTTNSIGDYVGLVALAVLVYRETEDPLATTALFVSAQFLPAFFAPMLTATRRPAAAAPDLARDLRHRGGRCSCVLALLVTTFRLAAVLVLTLIDGA